ncbi:energy transducer TonB [Leptolyngbya sp. GB1-A1]|uniref:hypothetical protein n=1 Tax=Leptolyngbya sp. GB1-A1 TaxID=2933908 RepID=UPI003298A54D
MSSSLRFQDFSTLQKNAQQWLKHPAVWSGIVSVGAHGLLFALLPLLPSDALRENPPDLQRSVDLVELTPEEQQRLPEFSNELPVELPSIAQTPSQSPSDLFTTLPPLSNETLPPIAPSFINPLPLPSFPIFPILPPSRTPLQIPAPTVPPNPPASPLRSPSPEASPSAAASPQPSPSPASDAPAPDASSAPESPPTAENPPAPSQPSPSEQLIARQQELRQLYTYNPEGTSNESALQSDTDWLKQVTDSLGENWDEDAQENLDRDKIVEIAGVYPRAACIRRLSASVILGVMVDGEGKLLEEPVPPAILRSSGYAVFNQLAVEAAAAHAFEAAEKPLPYRVLVKFEPSNEVCPPGTAPESAPEAPPS